MKLHIQHITLLAVLALTHFSFSQYKHDIGLRLSTFEEQELQLDYRFHTKTPYSIVVSAVTGSRGHGNYSQSPIYNDTLFSVAQYGWGLRNYGLNVGVQRRLTGLATDVFYVGANIGTSWQLRDYTRFSGVYSIPDTTGLNGNYFAYPAAQVSSEWENRETEWLVFQLGLTFGMDVQLTKRIVFNAEISCAGMLEHSLTDNFQYFNLRPVASGGIRYRFGVRE